MSDNQQHTILCFKLMINCKPMIVTKKYVISTPYIDAYLKRISYGTDKPQVRVTTFIVMNVQ